LLFEIGSYYVAEAGLELVILLPQPIKCWDYRHEIPYPASSNSLSFVYISRKTKIRRHSLLFLHLSEFR
jgi:hypothetical protein